MFTLTWARATDAPIGTSPDGRFAFLQSKESIQLVALPSRKVVIPEVFYGEGIGEPTVLWSQDGNRFAACVQSARSSECEAYQRRNGSFSKMTLPYLEPRFYSDLKPKVSMWLGQSMKPEQWKNNTLVLTTDGAVNLTNNTFVHYTYEYNIAFDERGKGKVVSVEKKHYD